MRFENAASMTDRLKGRSERHPVGFVDWRVMLFSYAAQFRLLVPALNREASS